MAAENLIPHTLMMMTMTMLMMMMTKDGGHHVPIKYAFLEYHPQIL